MAFFAATLLYNGGNFVFHMAMSRMLGPDRYGALGSLLGLVTVAVLPVSALQAAVTQSIATRRSPPSGSPRAASHLHHALTANGEVPLRRPFAWTCLGAGVLLVLLVALAPIVDRFVNVRSPAPLLLLGTYVATAVATIVPQGVLIGRLRFRPVAASLVVGSVVRLAAGVTLVAMGFGLDAAAAASALSGIASLGIVLWPMRGELAARRQHSGTGERAPTHRAGEAVLADPAGVAALTDPAAVAVLTDPAGVVAVVTDPASEPTASGSIGSARTADASMPSRSRRSHGIGLHAGPALLAVTALAGVSAFLGIDSLLARHYLSHLDAGDYVAAATAARIALFLPGAVAMTVFPRLAAAHGDHRQVRRLLLHALAVTVALSGGAALVIAAFPHLVIAVLFGSAYQAASGPVTILAAAAAAMGIASVLVYFFLAQRSLAATVCWAAVALVTGLIVVVHDGLDTIAWITLGVTGAMTLCMAAMALGQRHPERARQGRARDDRRVSSTASTLAPGLALATQSEPVSPKQST